MSIDINPVTFRREIAPARTFGFAEQLMQLRRRGLALGGSIKNAILLREGRVANPDGLRFRDEFVRHKVLDVIGDLSLVGTPIIGHYHGNRPGHRLNIELLNLLMNDRDAWVRVTLDELGEMDIAHLGGVDTDAKALAMRDGRLQAGQPKRRSRQPALAGSILRLFGDGRK